MRLRLSLAFVAVLTASACRSATLQQGPSDTLRAYARALDEGRADDAYKLLSSEAKRSISLDAFRRMVKENAAEMKDIAHALARPASDPVVTATVVSPKGEKLLARLRRRALEARRIVHQPLRAVDPAAVDRGIFARFRAQALRRDAPLRPRRAPEGLDADKLRSRVGGRQKEEMAAHHRRSARRAAHRAIRGDRRPRDHGLRLGQPCSSCASTARGRSKTSTRS